MEKILILDDDELRHRQFSKKYETEELTHVYTSTDCINMMKDHEFDYVFLDHDLGGQQMVSSGDGTGYEVAKWIAENSHRKPSKMVILHSVNPVGRKNMCDVLTGAGIDAISSPFLWKR